MQLPGAQWCGRLVRSAMRRSRVRIALLRARSASRSRLLARPRRLLVVCYGNIYRSPFLAAALSDLQRVGVEVRSAGFHARAGRATPNEFQQLAARYGVDLSLHRSTTIEESMVEWAEAILLMDRHNWDRLRLLSRSAVSKAIWVGALAGNEPVEIPDPYGGSSAEMQLVAERLWRAGEAIRTMLTNAARPYR